jgi:protein tyrosine/serine phosphatase
MLSGRLKRPIAHFFSMAIVVIMGFGAYLAFLQLSGNFHTVIPGELYRSAQPSPSQLELYAKKYGVKTVVNLRGSSEKAWYDREIATGKRLGLTHIDFAMSASKGLAPAQADQLVALLKDAPKPILLHCRSGADRTGLVSVIYSQQVAGLAEDTAERQLSIFFGHVAIPYFSPAFAMDENWRRLEDHFGVEENDQPARG